MESETLIQKSHEVAFIRREKITCKFTVGVKVKPSMKVMGRLDNNLVCWSERVHSWTSATAHNSPDGSPLGRDLGSI